LGWLDDAVKVLQLISLPILIVVTLYGMFSPYLTEFWRGFMLGVLVVLLPMLVFNIYLARRERKPHEVEAPSHVLDKSEDKREIESKLREVYSPIHAMIMTVKQYIPSETARRLSLGGFVPGSMVSNLAEVSRAFQHHDLENRHLKKWLELEAEIKQRGGFYINKDRQAWFDELDAAYQRQVAELKKL